MAENQEIKEIKFPDGFLWGTSTSAYQIEGGNVNDWSEWEKSAVRINKLIKNKKAPKDFISAEACDSYNRFKLDLDLAASLNTNAIRLGIEWSRLQPKKDMWDVDAVKHYQKVLAEAKKRNLKTVVTLWHWTNPVWFAEEGGWAGKDAARYYLDYADFVIKNLGGDIDFWVTLNEPMIHIFNGYIKGNFPPAKRNIFKARKVFYNLVKANNSAYKLIHSYFPNSKVSITALVNYFEAARSWFLPEKILAYIFNYYWNHKFLKNIKNYCDYIGLDYYFHDRIIWYPPFVKNKNISKTDLGWEIYPEGIYHVLKYLKKFNKSIYVLENGLADGEDNLRAQFIKDHLFYIHKAIAEGVDVRGYFYWSLLDNFEWDKGWQPKFGLFMVNRVSFARIRRPSADVYAEICKNNKFIKRLVDFKLGGDTKN